MSLIRFLYAPHDLMFVKGIIFKNVDLQKHQKCSTFKKAPQSGLFAGFLMDTIATADKPTRYGKNNKFTYSEQPTAIGQGSERTINIFCAVPDAA